MKTFTAPVGGLLYSLLHLGGFDGDLSFYCHRATGRVLEMGCGDGRLAAALCLGTAPLTVLQQQQDAETGAPAVAAVTPPQMYVGIELCEPLAMKARERMETSPCVAEVVVGDFLEQLPAERRASFDTVIVSANTLFATPAHDVLLANCAEALVPDGRLLLDVYNSLLWHGSEDDTAEDGDDEAAFDDEPTLLVRVQDENERTWTVYEREPSVDSTAQRITCTYEFEAVGAEDAPESESAPSVFTEQLVHNYLLPEELVRLLDTSGFAIEELYGDFSAHDSASFDPVDSEHVVVIARRK